MMNIVVYTALFGDRDVLHPIPVYATNARFVLFTDKPRAEEPVAPLRSRPGRLRWEQIIVKQLYDPRRTARYYKTHPHLLFPEADVTIWTDCNISLRIPPELAISKWLKSGFAALKHPKRNCLYAEARTCIAAGNDNPEIIAKQVTRYEQMGMPQNSGLMESGVLIRENNPEINEINESWWAEIKEYSVRDQISLPFVLWRSGRAWDVIGGGNVRQNHNFIFYRHAYNRGGCRQKS